MKKFLLSFVMLLFVVGYAAAQRTVTGKVASGQGGPLVGASVVVKGTTNGTLTDADGNFSLTVPPTALILSVSFVGHETQDVTLGASNVVEVTLAESSTLQEVIVTGLNIKRSEKSLPYAAQTVKSEQLATIRQTNVNDALAGKVAGIQVRSQSAAALGKEANIRIRGAGSLKDKQPLYVVDGTPIATASDLNGDDIETITVLKGPSATAIYGQRGDAGVILVTTKKGKRNGGIGIEFSQASSWENVYVLPRYQNSYAGGDGDWQLFKWKTGMPAEWKAFEGKKYHDYSDDASWGPKIDGSEYIPWYAWYPGTQYSNKTTALTAQPDNIKQFYETGEVKNTNLSFTQAGDNFSSRYSISNQNTKGLTPTTGLNKFLFSTQQSIDLGKHFTIGANINYVTDKLTGLIDDAYSNQTTGSFGSWFHRNLDMKIIKELKDLRSPEGYLASWNHLNPDSYLSSPLDFYGANYWYNFNSFQDNVSYIKNRKRLFGDINLTYKINDKFKIAGFVRKNQLTTDTENKGGSLLETSATQTGFKGFLETANVYNTEDNYEALASYTDRFGALTVEANLGGNIRKDRYVENYAATKDGLVIPNFYSLSNSVTLPYNDVVTKDGVLQTPNYRINKEVRSVYARGSFGFKDMIFVDWSARNDWSSALPAGANSYFYPSIGGSFVFSELIGNKFPALSFGKIRASWAQVGSDVDAYEITKVYTLAAKAGSNIAMFTPNALPDPNIKPSLSSAYEIGADLRFFKNRVGASITYYNESKRDEILSVPVSGTSGYTSKLINAARLDRNGVELQLNIVPVKTSLINWDITINLAKNSSKILGLAPGIGELVQQTGTFGTSSGVLLVHKDSSEWGQLRGGGFKRDANGNKIVDAKGLFVVAQNTYLGSVLPSLTGGILNTLVIGDIELRANIDFQQGGKFFSLSDAWGTFSGLTQRTAELNDKGKNVRDDIADGGGVHVVAVTADGAKFDKYVDAYDYFHQFRGRRIAEEHVYDLTFIKLRELSIGYKVPVKKLGFTKYIQGATIALIARNPLLMYAQTKDFDPSEISNLYGENGQLPGTRSVGFNLKLSF